MARLIWSAALWVCLQSRCLAGVHRGVLTWHAEPGETPHPSSDFDRISLMLLKTCDLWRNKWSDDLNWRHQQRTAICWRGRGDELERKRRRTGEEEEINWRGRGDELERKRRRTGEEEEMNWRHQQRTAICWRGRGDELERKRRWTGEEEMNWRGRGDELERKRWTERGGGSVVLTCRGLPWGGGVCSSPRVGCPGVEGLVLTWRRLPGGGGVCSSSRVGCPGVGGLWSSPRVGCPGVGGLFLT